MARQQVEIVLVAMVVRDGVGELFLNVTQRSTSGFVVRDPSGQDGKCKSA